MRRLLAVVALSLTGMNAAAHEPSGAYQLRAEWLPSVDPRPAGLDPDEKLLRVTIQPAFDAGRSTLSWTPPSGVTLRVFSVLPALPGDPDLRSLRPGPISLGALPARATIVVELAVRTVSGAEGIGGIAVDGTRAGATPLREAVGVVFGQPFAGTLNDGVVEFPAKVIPEMP